MSENWVRLVSALFLVNLSMGPALAQGAQNLPLEVVAYADLALYNGQVLTMDGDQPPIGCGKRRLPAHPPSGW